MKRFAMVEFVEKAAVALACNLTGTEVDGKNITVDVVSDNRGTKEAKYVPTSNEQTLFEIKDRFREQRQEYRKRHLEKKFAAKKRT